MKFSNIKNFWFNLPIVVRYLFTGGYNFAVSFIIFTVIILILTEKHSQLSLILSYVLSSFNSYFSQKILVFQTKGNYVNEYLKCSLTWFVTYILNALLLKLLFEIMGINVYLAQFISLATVSVVTYLLFKYFSFRAK